MTEKETQTRKAATMSRTTKTKRWVLDAHLDAILDGRVDEEEFLAGLRRDGRESDARRLERMLRDSRRPQPATVTLTGRIVRETERAVLFAIHDDQESTAAGLAGELWFPKTHCHVYERSMGPADQVIVPEWLAKKKAEELSK